jgi:Fe-S-cluster containining protein
MEMPPDFLQQVYRAAGRAEARHAVGQLYDDLQVQLSKRRPRCDASGRCCRFEEFDHQLFVTTMEMGTFLFELETRGLDYEAGSIEWDGAGCPFQQNRLCGVHPFRPFGCRIFFCDPAVTSWQQEQCEAFHQRLKNLHLELSVPYYYVEWRRALLALGIARLSSPTRSL